MRTQEGLPKKAVEPLIEFCGQEAEATEKSTRDLFEYYLTLMKKHGDFFFAKPWDSKPSLCLGLEDDEQGFVDGAQGYADMVERFTLVYLRRKISVEGFDMQGFKEGLEFDGRLLCKDCCVPDTARLKADIERIERLKKDAEEKVKAENPSYTSQGMQEYLLRPDVMRRDKMQIVQLRFYREIGLAGDKTCSVENRFKCPYGEGSNRLVQDGAVAHDVWRVVEWYDEHWNGCSHHVPASSDSKWYHYGEPGVIDVTDYEDVLKSIEDGRLEKVVKEREAFNEATAAP